METEWMNETSAEAPSVPAPEKTEKKKFSLKGFGGKKKKRWLKILIILVVVIAIVAGCVSRLTKNVNTQLSSSYLVSTVTRQDLTVSVSGTATLQPADSYNVTTLLSGDIVSAPFEEGDLVTKDTLLYTMDSSDAQDSMDRAQISVQQAQMSYQQAQEALHPTAPISGTVSEIYVHNGESVTAGTQLAKIVASTELSIDFLFPFASPSDFYVGQAATVFVDGYAGSQMGTVTYVSNSTTITSNGKEAVSVRVRLNNPGTVSDAVTASAIIGSYSSYGQAPVSMPASSVVYASGSGTVNDFSKLAGSTVTKGEVLCTVESETIRDQIESARLNLQSAQLSASTASGAVDDYNIKSPIAGTVIEKNFKAGDKVDGASSGTLAVIYDLSYLELENAKGADPEYVPLPKFPAVTRDIAVVCDRAVTVGALEDCIRRGAKGLLKDVSLFDIYTGSGIPEGKKSVAFNLTLRSDDRSLTAQEADEDVKSILETLKAELNAVLR